MNFQQLEGTEAANLDKILEKITKKANKQLKSLGKVKYIRNAYIDVLDTDRPTGSARLIPKTFSLGTTRVDMLENACNELLESIKHSYHFWTSEKSKVVVLIRSPIKVFAGEQGYKVSCRVLLTDSFATKQIDKANTSVGSWKGE